MAKIRMMGTSRERSRSRGASRQLASVDSRNGGSFRDAQPLTPAAPPSRSGGRWMQRLILFALIALGAWYGFQEVRNRMLYVQEIDARIEGELITMSSRVSGWLTELDVRAGDTVKRGQVLGKVDARESQLLVNELNARAEGVAAERNRMLAERELIDLQTRTRLETQLSIKGFARNRQCQVLEQFRVHRTWAAVPLPP